MPFPNLCLAGHKVTVYCRLIIEARCCTVCALFLSASDATKLRPDLIANHDMLGSRVAIVSIGAGLFAQQGRSSNAHISTPVLNFRMKSGGQEFNRFTRFLRDCSLNQTVKPRCIKFSWNTVTAFKIRPYPFPHRVCSADPRNVKKSVNDLEQHCHSPNYVKDSVWIARCMWMYRQMAGWHFFPPQLFFFFKHLATLASNTNRH